jgi:16S rRNA G966 N2-methylase RsmD
MAQPTAGQPLLAPFFPFCISAVKLELALVGDAQVVKADVLVWVKSSSAQFDLVLADPPYDLPELSVLPDMFFHLLKEDGILVLEHGKDHLFEQHPHCFKEKRFGHVHFSFFSKLAQ